MDGTYVRYFARFFLLIMMPFLFGAFVLPHTSFVKGDDLGSPEEVRSGENLSYSFIHPNGEITLPQSVNAIFPLANFLNFPPLVSHYAPQLCFEDNDSYLLLQDGAKYDPEFVWIVDLNNNTLLAVQPDGINCTDADLTKKNEYRWYVQMALPLNDSRFRGNVTLVPQTSAYPRITMDYGLLQGMVMIPVAYLFVWYPAAGIWKKMHKGMLEQ